MEQGDPPIPALETSPVVLALLEREVKHPLHRRGVHAWHFVPPTPLYYRESHQQMLLVQADMVFLGRYSQPVSNCIELI